ncbi:MAG TPA: PKD domain-containing protein [Planctomycetota bacterium]|jgi:hypothetical protein|nr:MAG: Protease 1 precursor [Planctomycetes bacterium ADurb.Bin069]HNR98304.1 PKD domain-containing protein [Planctomycetota bacterium]HNU24622.1 PKD domain-containing protein [Planctomycetota bacterium]HOE28984.1 PKD domain-containing protein [Planctomycetota bacterium]HOE85906.1 PKD domain-containing protein [Planctomycetota bacterium]
MAIDTRLAVALALVVALGSAAAGTLIEDFTQADGPPEGWVVTGPTVEVRTGQLILTPGSAAEVGVVVGKHGQPTWFDRLDGIEAQITFPGNTLAWPFDHGGIFFCAQVPRGRYQTTCYVVDYLAVDGAISEAPGRFRLAKFNNGVEEPLAQTPATIVDYEGLWSIALTDTEIVFTYEGQEMIRHANADLRGGYMGFWAYQTPSQNFMTVDDLAVTYTPAACPVFRGGKIGLVSGRENQLAAIRIPTGANDTAPYVVTITSANTAVAFPVGHTGGSLAHTFAAGTAYTQFVPIAPGIPGETVLALSVQGEDCSGVSLPVEVNKLVAYEEHFDQPDGPPVGWYIASQSALVINEVLSLRRGTADPFVWYAVDGVPVRVGKMESVTCRIRFADIADTSVGVHGGLVLSPEVTAVRSLGYMIDVIERASDNGYRIYKDNLAVVQLGGPRQPYVWDNEFHEWKVLFTPTGFTFSVDGVQLADVEDLTYRGGYLSFWCYTAVDAAQNMFVDDIRIEFGASPCPVITPPAANNRPPNPKTVYTVIAPLGSNLTADYSLTVTSTQPSVAIPEGAVNGALTLTYPRNGLLAQTFNAVCLSPGTTEFVVTAPGVSCPSAKASFTVREPGLAEFCDDFTQNDGPPEQWTPFLGNWEVVDGALTVGCAPGGTERGETWLWLGSPPEKVEAASLSFTVDLSQDVEDAVGRHGGVMFFARDPTIRWDTSGYQVDWIDRESDHGYRFIRYDNGVATALGSPTFDAYELGRYWKLEIDGENLRFYANGELIFDVIDPTYREGYVGLWTYCNTTRARYDDFAIGECGFLAPPTAAFTASPLSGAAPLAVSFDASASSDDGTIVSYAWDFGDGGTGTGIQTAHTYSAGGKFTVTLTVTDDDGLTGRATATITVEGGAGTQFKRGDTNADGKHNIADAVCLLGFLFGPESDPCKQSVANCRDAADANNDGKIDIADAIKILGYLFTSATSGPLPQPFPDCGWDPAEPADTLDCVAYKPCQP